MSVQDSGCVQLLYIHEEGHKENKANRLGHGERKQGDIIPLGRNDRDQGYTEKIRGAKKLRASRERRDGNMMIKRCNEKEACRNDEGAVKKMGTTPATQKDQV